MPAYCYVQNEVQLLTTIMCDLYPTMLRCLFHLLERPKRFYKMVCAVHSDLQTIKQGGMVDDLFFFLDYHLRMKNLDNIDFFLDPPPPVKTLFMNLLESGPPPPIKGAKKRILWWCGKLDKSTMEYLAELLLTKEDMIRVKEKKLKEYDEKVECKNDVCVRKK